MWLKESEFHVKLGGNTYIDTPILIAYKGESLFELSRQEDGQLGIGFQIFDARGKKVASIRRNNIYFGDKALYEIDGGADRIALRERSSGAVLVGIKKRKDAIPAELEVVVRTYLPDGRVLDLGPDSTNLGGFQMTGCVMRSCATGINIG